MTLTALMTATVAVLSQLSVPLPFGVPITLQVFALALGGYILGPKYGSISALLYVTLGAVGLPVFSNFQGGLHHIVASPTGGFILGFVFISLFSGISWLFKWKRLGRLYALLLGFSGVLLCHLCGSMQYASVAAVPFTTAALTVSLPFILKDILLSALACLLSERLKRLLRYP